jgi:hypothetical protein
MRSFTEEEWAMLYMLEFGKHDPVNGKARELNNFTAKVIADVGTIGYERFKSILAIKRGLWFGDSP